MATSDPAHDHPFLVCTGCGAVQLADAARPCCGGNVFRTVASAEMVRRLPRDDYCDGEGHEGEGVPEASPAAGGTTTATASGPPGQLELL